MSKLKCNIIMKDETAFFPSKNLSVMNDEYSPSKVVLGMNTREARGYEERCMQGIEALR